MAIFHAVQLYYENALTKSKGRKKKEIQKRRERNEMLDFTEARNTRVGNRSGFHETVVRLEEGNALNFIPLSNLRSRLKETTQNSLGYLIG